jgi:hypothetical protein
MARLVRGGALLLILAAVGCGGSGGGASGSAAADCAKVPLADNSTAGCNIHLAQPIGCQTLDLTNGKTATLEWTASGCATPWKLCVGGSPADFITPTNAGCLDFSVNGANITATTGIVTVRATDLATLTSPSGVYYWTVASWYGSHPATQAFKILK